MNGAHRKYNHVLDFRRSDNVLQNGGYAYDFDFLPDGRRWLLYRKEYSEPNLTNAGSGMIVGLPLVAHLPGSSYSDGAHRRGPPIRNESAKVSLWTITRLPEPALRQWGPTPPRFEQQRDIDISIRLRGLVVKFVCRQEGVRVCVLMDL